MGATRLFLIAALYAGAAQAATENALPSCYDSKLGVTPAPVQTEVFVMVDQTTLFDQTLQQQLAENIRPFMGADNAYSVLTFSAFSQGRYAQVLTAGTIEAGIPQAVRDDISKPLLSKFDACSKRQPNLAMQSVGAALRTAFTGASADLAKSDVLASLKSMATRVKKSSASDKVVLVASDMLENSSVTSFYENKGQSVRLIDPAREMKVAADNELLADFGGARVYIIGAGLLADDTKKGARTRDVKTMRMLSNFWQTWFQKSNATVVEFGQPALLNPVTRKR